MAKKLKALIVEDSASSQIMLQSILSVHAQCDGALDGVSAIGKFRDAVLTDQPYDFICMDITMPKMDGKTALSIMREIERQKGKGETPVIMITSAGSTLNRIETMHELRATSFLTKPITPEALIAELGRLNLLPR